MNTCIARRAHGDRYSFRLLKEGKEGKYIWTEFRCPNVVSGGANVCVDCSKKLPKYKYQSNQKCDHGLVGGPYPTDSKLYGSPFYLKQLKEGFVPLEADELRAKEAVDTANSKMPRKKVVVPSEAVVAQVPVPVAVPVAVPVVTAAPIPKPTPAKKPRTIKLKAKPVPLETPNTPAPIERSESATMLESMALPPITVSEVIVVKVKKLRHKGKDYYFDSNSGKLYTALAKEVGVGVYAGRYNLETETLDTEYPDSDVEV